MLINYFPFSAEQKNGFQIKCLPYSATGEIDIRCETDILMVKFNSLRNILEISCEIIRLRTGFVRFKDIFWSSNDST